jgi:hypothetical protein
MKDVWEMHACNGVPAGFSALQKFRRASLRLEIWEQCISILSS